MYLMTIFCWSSTCKDKETSAW